MRCRAILLAVLVAAACAVIAGRAAASETAAGGLESEAPLDSDGTMAGAVSIRCAVPASENGSAPSRPVLSLRWRLVHCPSGASCVTIPYRVTLESSEGSVAKQELWSVTRLLGTNPKIDGIDPDRVTNDRDWHVSINGREFVETPKVTLRSATTMIQLEDVAFLDPRAVSVTIPKGTKIGVYKVQLENPDGGSDQYQSLTVEGKYNVHLPIIVR